MCIKPRGKGRQCLGSKFWCQQKVLKKITFEVRFYTFFFMFSCMYIAPGQEQTTPWWQSFDVNRKPRSLRPFVASFKMISLNSDFIHIINYFTHVYSPGARADKPLGSKFWCQQKALTTSTICCKFQKNLFEFWFYTHFLMFFHMYIALGQGQTTLCGQNSDVNRKALPLYPFVANFKKISLRSGFIHIFACFYTCIYTWGRGRQPCGVRSFILT